MNHSEHSKTVNSNKNNDTDMNAFGVVSRLSQGQLRETMKFPHLGHKDFLLAFLI